MRKESPYTRIIGPAAAMLPIYGACMQFGYELWWGIAIHMLTFVAVFMYRDIFIPAKMNLTPRTFMALTFAALLVLPSVPVTIYSIQMGEAAFTGNSNWIANTDVELMDRGDGEFSISGFSSQSGESITEAVPEDANRIRLMLEIGTSAGAIGDVEISVQYRDENGWHVSHTDEYSGRAEFYAPVKGDSWRLLATGTGINPRNVEYSFEVYGVEQIECKQHSPRECRDL